MESSGVPSSGVPNSAAPRREALSLRCGARVVDTAARRPPPLELAADHRLWPAEERKRRKRYLQLAQKNHPDKRGRGGRERFEFLLRAYKRANFLHDPEQFKEDGDFAQM